MAAVALVLVLMVVVVMMVRRAALGFGGRPRSGTAGTGAVALGAGQRVLKVTLEADFFLNY